MVRHVESSQESKVQEENELLKQQLQLHGSHRGDRPSILGEQQQQERPPADKETSDEQQKEDKLQAKVEVLTKLIQEKES